MLSTDNLVTGALVYASIGSLIWLGLWCRGVIHQVQVKRRSPAIDVVIASLWVIVAWPAVACALCRAVLEGARR